MKLNVMQGLMVWGLMVLGAYFVGLLIDRLLPMPHARKARQR